jgi:hypothetical protein
VLVDPAEKAIFIAKAEGGIEALAIATGKTLWQTNKEEGARWLVAVYGRTLVVRARANPLRIAGLDLDANGKVLWMTEPVLPEWVKGPEWLKEMPRRNRELPEWVPEEQRNKPTRPDLKELGLALVDKVKGTYRCEEQIEKREFVMRWQAKTDPIDAKAKDGSGVVFVDLETGKVRTQPLGKDRKIEEKGPRGEVEWNGIVLSVAVGKHVTNWFKTDPPYRGIIEGRYLEAVDKQTRRLLWERALWEWGYWETKRVNGGYR